METSNGSSSAVLGHRHGVLTPFVVTAVSGTLLILLVSIVADSIVQTATIGLLVSLGGGLLAANLQQLRQHDLRLAAFLTHLRLPLILASDHQFFDQYQKLAAGLIEIGKQPSPVLRHFAALRISAISEEIHELGRGKAEFHSTETWRTVYRDLLQGLTVKSYYSVAWVKSKDYWDDPPGRHSIRLNLELADRSYRIERMLIIPDELWPFDASHPAPEMLRWIREQQDHGIHIALVREHELLGEPELLCDFGIYGDQAVGFQELDDQSKTVRYTLDFDPATRRNALDRWERLRLYAIPFTSLLDDNPTI